MKVCISTFLKPHYLAVFSLITAGLLQSVDAAKLYKWIDENGEVRYSDRIPVKKKHETLNSQGIVVGTTEAAKTEEELLIQKKLEKKQAKIEAEQQRLRTIQSMKDRVLLMTFSSEKELLLVHDNRLDVVESVIRLIKKSIVTTQEKLLEFELSAEVNYLSKKLVVPGGLAQNIEHFTRKVTNRQAELELKQAEKNKIKLQFETDVSRFRELRELEKKKLSSQASSE